MKNIKAVILLITMTVVFSACSSHEANNDFVEHQLTGSANTTVFITNPRTLKEIVDHAELIVTGEIVAVEDLEEVIMMKEGTPEKEAADLREQPGHTIRSGTNYTIKVSEVLKGKILEPEVILYLTEDAQEISPQLSQGERYIFTLYWNDITGRYNAGHPTASYYLINDNQEIVPFFVGAKDFEELENRSYKNIKSKFKQS